MFSMEGNLPSPVFKGYDDQRYSPAFAERGRIRLGALLTYRRIESAGRRDASEGEARLLIPHDITTLYLDRQTLQLVGESVAPGHLNYGGSLHNPLYTFCVAGPDVQLDHLRRKFGCHVIEIFDTTAFLAELESSLVRLELGGRELLFVDSCPVRYDKDQIGEYPTIHRDRLLYAQKSSEHALDCEWRVVVALSGPLKEAPEELFLDLANPNLFCREMSS
jgi:hypothetical protein